MASEVAIHKMMKRMNGRGAFNAASLRQLRKIAVDVLDAQEVCPPDKQVFVIVSSSAEDGWVCHKAGCSDVGRALAEANGAFVFTGTASQLPAQVITDDIREMGWSEDNVHLYPCCKKH